MSEVGLHSRRKLIRNAAVAIAGPELWRTAAMAAELGDEGRMPDLGGATGWLNSEPLTARGLRGKVVLVDFWTYSCINSLRHLPYLRAWAAKYQSAGLVVVGVHSPEFAFEKDTANVTNAVAEMKVNFPVAIDTNHAIWRAFRNEYWPADYFVDAKGRVRHHHFGEGDYGNSERVIQTLLKENGVTNLDESLVRITAEGAEAPPSETGFSPETYTGYGRAQNFASPGRLIRDSRRIYTLPANLALNQWGLSGSWRAGFESSVLETAPGTVAFRFHSRDLHLVLGPPKNEQPVRFRIKLNSSAPGEHHGVDTRPDGSGEIRQPRMYQLIRQKASINNAIFEMEFLDAGVETFSFTFG